MPSHLEEITATYLRESFRFTNPDGDTVIARAWIKRAKVETEGEPKGECDRFPSAGHAAGFLFHVAGKKEKVINSSQVNGLYLIACAIAHPDAGGDTATFQRVQLAREVINGYSGVIFPVRFSDEPELEEITLKGQADLDELAQGCEYRFYGRWSNYKNKRTGESERQFHFQSFCRQAPHGREGVIAYLRSAGEGLGFGAARAAKCWELYGGDAVQALRERPAEVAEQLTQCGLRLPVEAATKIAKLLEEEQALEGCTLDLMDLLTGRGFPKGTSRLAVRAWGNAAAQIIRRNPYRLMQFRGCGFKKTDALYLDLQLPIDAIRRQGLAAWYSLARDTEGHTHYPLSHVQKGMRENLRAVSIDQERAIRFARKLGAVGECYTAGVGGPIVAGDPGAEGFRGSCRWLSEGKKSRHEMELAQCVADAWSEKPVLWPDAASVQGIDDHQRGQLAVAMRGVVGILGGGPGTGKTYTVACMVKYLVDRIGADNILIGAPTGKAAVRVTENLAGHGLSIRARTWHSLLMLLERQQSKKFFAKVLIGDETSMNDTDLMAAVFRARAVGCHVLLVGDVHQLPPVGHGAPLRDMINAGLPYGELTEIKRNSGGIVEACAAIKSGKRWEPADNLFVYEPSNAEGQIKTILGCLRQARADGMDATWDCQVVVPVNKKSPLSRRELNGILQNELNAGGIGLDGCPFRTGDKIVNTKNGFFPRAAESDSGDSDEEESTNDRGEVYVANGELAEVLQVEQGYLIAKLSNPVRVIKIPRGKASEASDDKEADPSQEGGESDSTGTGCSWELGYALSVHKSQGSEWKWVLVVLDEYPGAKMVCSREWLYTAISRAKEKCALIGKRDTADSMCHRVALGKRKTLLKERIHLARAKILLAEL